jgi:hypothetical protein
VPAGKSHASFSVGKLPPGQVHAHRAYQITVMPMR